MNVSLITQNPVLLLASTVFSSTKIVQFTFLLNISLSLTHCWTPPLVVPFEIESDLMSRRERKEGRKKERKRERKEEEQVLIAVIQVKVSEGERNIK